MSEDIFRLVITAAVALACLAFVVQAVVVILFYRTARKMQLKVDELVNAVEPVLDKLGPVVDKVGPVIDKTTPVIERFGPILEQASQTIERLGPVIDKTVEVIGRVGSVVEQAGPVVENARQVLATTNQVAADLRPRIAEVSDEAAAIARTSRQQVERIGALLNDATGRAHARLDQIDQSVESTVEQVGQVGDAMKRAVMRPVREANGLAAGISAAVSTLVKGPRKSSVDSATQDEEMFI
jgi:ABC-type transporter Mla subunit MlaD